MRGGRQGQMLFPGCAHPLGPILCTNSLTRIRRPKPACSLLPRTLYVVILVSLFHSSVSNVDRSNFSLVFGSGFYYWRNSRLCWPRLHAVSAYPLCQAFVYRQLRYTNVVSVTRTHTSCAWNEENIQYPLNVGGDKPAVRV